jgi:hypothetical protein
VSEAGWLDPSEWIRDGRGRSWTFALPTDMIVATLTSAAEDRNDRWTLLACSRADEHGRSSSVYDERPLGELRATDPWQYFVRSHVVTPVLPAPEPIPGVGWPARFAINGLILLHHPDPASRASDPPWSSVGIVHRAVHSTSGRVIQHTSYDEIYKALKRMLRRAALASHEAS